MNGIKLCQRCLYLFTEQTQFSLHFPESFIIHANQ